MNALAQAKALIEETWQDSKKWETNQWAAHNLLQHALKSDPDNLGLLIGLGTILCDQRRYSESASLLKKAIQLGTKDANAYFALAVVAFNSEGREKGMALFHEAAKHESDPETWEAYFDPHAQ